MKAEHYLKEELYNLIAGDPLIFEFIQEGSLDGIWYWDLENPDQEWMSPRFWTVLGYDPDTKAHDPIEWQNIINRDDLSIALSNFEKHLADPNHPYDQIVRYTHRDGSTVWIRCRGMAIRDDNGKPLRMLGAHQDLTLLKESEKELSKNRSLLEETARIAKIGGWEYYPGENKFYWTDEVYRIKEFDRDCNISFEMTLNTYHPDYRQDFQYAVEQAISENMPFNLDLRMITARGNERWVETIGRPIIENGKTIGCRGTIQDITEKKKTQEENERLTAQVHHASKMDALGQISSGIAHDFNNILTGIMSAANLLKIKGNDFDDKCKSYVDLILHASDNAAKLINKMMSFSRKEEEVTKIMDFNSLINETLEILEKSIDKKITLATNLTDKKTWIKGNNVSLENMIMNLCINASHAMPDGGRIEISTAYYFVDDLYCRTSSFELIPGNYIQLKITDEGEGIAAENLTKIFEPFFTTKEPGKGTGLGLAAVFGIIKAHHGAIMVHSEKGAGSEFEILLPLSDSSEKPEQSHHTVKSGEGTILLVDDEFINRITGKDILESLGYTVILAENGAVSINVFKEMSDRIDLVLMDVSMPEMDGIEALKLMRTRKPDLKAIVTTGHAESDKMNRLKEIGFFIYIKKPFGLSEISHKVFNMLNQ
ncbi:MAG: PAS domain-containing protein [Spirochaetales bacterium]|nr:PAS domain-containing protein [Spirochaetales bacterium]